MSHPIIRAVLTLAALATVTCAARAADVPSNDVRVGLYAVFYHTSADDLQGPYVPPGVNFNAENLNTLYFGYIRRLSSHFQAELAVGWPPVAKVDGKGLATVGSVPYNGQYISSARWVAPTLLLEYNFFDEGSRVRPFIGAGVNYTTFYDRDSTPAGNAASGGPTKISLSSSVGPAGTVGLHADLGHNWGFNVSYSVSRVNTHLEADTAGLVRTSGIRFGPQALIMSVGYAF